MFLELMFWFLVGHAYVDFGWQTSFVGKFKYRKYANELPTEHKLNEVWPWCLTMHGLMHGGWVAAILGLMTGNWPLGIFFGFVEFLAHTLIDFSKCEGKIDVHQDQILHFICKALIAVAVVVLF